VLALLIYGQRLCRSGAQIDRFDSSPRLARPGGPSSATAGRAAAEEPLQQPRLARPGLQQAPPWDPLGRIAHLRSDHHDVVQRADHRQELRQQVDRDSTQSPARTIAASAAHGILGSARSRRAIVTQRGSRLGPSAGPPGGGRPGAPAAPRGDHDRGRDQDELEPVDYRFLPDRATDVGPALVGATCHRLPLSASSSKSTRAGQSSRVSKARPLEPSPRPTAARLPAQTNRRPSCQRAAW
jgi:hypothetical protein